MQELQDSHVGLGQAERVQAHSLDDLVSHSFVNDVSVGRDCAAVRGRQERDRGAGQLERGAAFCLSTLRLSVETSVPETW
jgi:hypothetical protein